MQIIGVDLHTRRQTGAMLNVETGEIVEKTLRYEVALVREFYSTLAGPTRVGRIKMRTKFQIYRFHGEPSIQLAVSVTNSGRNFPNR